MRTTIFALTVLLFATPVMAEGWICIADQASGFTYDKKAKKWKATALKTEAKYIIRRPKPDDKNRNKNEYGYIPSEKQSRAVEKFGDKYPT